MQARALIVDAMPKLLFQTKRKKMEQDLIDAGHSPEQASELVQKNQNNNRYYGEKISDNMLKTPEGYLVCLDVVIATSQPMEYNNSDIGLDTENITVMMTNPWEELSAPSTIASFEAKPVTSGHPDARLLNEDTATELIHGLVVNVRADEQNQTLLADLVIISSKAIAAISDGIKEVSCGYSSVSIVDNGDGTGSRIGIIGNHVAIVPKGRCGAQCSINDTKDTKMDESKKDIQMDESKTILEKIKAIFVDAEDPKDEEVFDAKSSFDALSKEVSDMKNANDANSDKMDQILALLTKLLDAENAETETETDGEEDQSANDADDVVIAPVKVVIPDKSILDADDTRMTASKMNEVAAQFYKKG